MLVEIEGVQRECCVTSVPKGSFCIWDINEGLYGFPQFMVIAPSITEDEKSCGNIVVCPVECYNKGFEYASPSKLYDSLYIDIFKPLVIGRFKSYVYDNIEDVFKEVYNEFIAHGTYICAHVEKYMENKEYLQDKELIEYGN